MKKASLLFCGVIFMTAVFAQSPGRLWSPIEESAIKPLGERVIIPKKYRTFHAETEMLKALLWSAPDEKDVKLKDSQVILELPMPDGAMQRFRVVQSSVMAPELAAQFPDIKTFNVMGVDSTGTFGKLDLSEMGFHGMIRKVSGDIFIDPYCRNNYTDYITYNTADFEKDPSQVAPEINVVAEGKKKDEEAISTNVVMICSGTELRTYRLAVACTGEYAVAATGLASPTVSQTLAKIVTTVNRVDGVYETEIAVKLVLIAAESTIVFTNATTDPFTANNDGSALLDESQTVIDANIGSANYDIGHTFSTGGGGIAYLGCVCSSIKAKGVTGSTNPVGDPYDIDYVAHEMGHQFGGNHPFRAITGGCGGNQHPGTMVEPGSGITIMSYAGICTSTNDIAAHSIAYFHTISFDETMAYSNNGNGNTCPVKANTSNHPPVVTGSATFTIPKSTPFTLTGSATDPDGDPLTYSWEEVDNNSTGGNWNDGQKPYFRSYNPIASPSRTFPSLANVLAGTYTTTKGEFLPSSAQTLNFRLTARDNQMGGGGVCYATSQVVVAASGPLTLTYPNTTGITWASTSSQTITWNVNGTDAAPVNCANVDLLISFDGGNTFALWMSNVPNTGSKLVTAPTLTVTKTTCRVKVQGAGNIFFDVSDKNFTITAGMIGVSNITTANMAMQLFPNPASDQLQVDLFGMSKNENVKVVIRDIVGNELMREELNGKDEYNLKYDISKYTKGIYIIEVTGTNKIGVSKFVKE